MSKIRVLCVMFGVGIPLGLTMKYASVQQVPATVTRLHWVCQTILEESRPSVIPVAPGVFMPVTGWRDIISSYASGDGHVYSCSHLPVLANQREWYRVAFFITFVDQTGATYEYRVKDYFRYKDFEVNSRWVIGLNLAREVVKAQPVP